MSTSSPLSAPPEVNDDGVYNKVCEEHERLMETLPKGKGWMVEHLYNYNGFWLHPRSIKNNMLLHIYFKSEPTDIFLASSVKAGTTWLKALMFATNNRHRYNFSDHHLLQQSPHSAIPFIDSEVYPPPDFSHIPAPRLFATHYPRDLLPASITSSKFVYICRDPKDVLISKWHYMNKLRPKDLAPFSLDEAFELFTKGVSDYGPIWEHVLSYWRASLESPHKILFLKYEEMKMQPEVELRKLAAFMGKPFTVEEEEKGVVAEIVKLCSFEFLSSLEVNRNGVQKFGKFAVVENRHFFRNGEIGDWQNYLSQDMKEKIDRITDEKLKGTGLILGARV